MFRLPCPCPMPHAPCPTSIADSFSNSDLGSVGLGFQFQPLDTRHALVLDWLGTWRPPSLSFSRSRSPCLCLFLYVSPGVDFVDFLALSSRIINWVDEQHLSVSKTLDYLAVPLTPLFLPLPPLHQALDICMYIHRTRETSPRFKMHLPLLFHDIFSYCWMGFLLQLAGDGTRCESVIWTATANLIMAVSQLFRLAQGRLIDTKT